MDRRVSIQWTATAKDQLAELPSKVRRGILQKADGLLNCDDPRSAHKPLSGPLQGYYRFTYARYRAIYSVGEERLPNDNIVIHIRIKFIAVGQRKERDKRDIYRIAEKMVGSGFISLTDLDRDDPSDSMET